MILMYTNLVVYKILGGFSVKVIVDQDTCIGCGMCFDICPEIFVCNDDNKSEVSKEDAIENFGDKIREAQEICPVGAITVEE